MRAIEVLSRPPDASGMRHAAYLYRSEEDLLDRMVPLARAALDRDEPVALALRPTTQETVFLRLGEPSGIVRMTHPDDPETASGQTLAARRARELRSLTTASGPVTVLSEHWDRYDGPDGTFWTELDAALAIALADLPVSLTCFFPDLPLHKAVLDGAMVNHPVLLSGGGPAANPGYLPPREVIATTPARAPLVLRPPDLRRQFGAWALNEVRATVELELIGIGFDRERAEDVVLAVNEIATNAVEHGSPEAELALWTDPGDGIVAEVHDSGVLSDVLPGLVAPHPSEPRGRGVWIARQICDTLHVWADGTGTHVRVRAAP